MRALFMFACCSLLAGSAWADEPACAGLGPHRNDTVIVLSPPSAFTICRRGKAQDDVVAGRPVWLMLGGTGPSLFEYRVHGDVEEGVAQSGLGVWQARAASLGRSLEEIGHSLPRIRDLPASGPPPSDPAQRAVWTARMAYLGVATPDFDEGVKAVSPQLDELMTIADAVERWCGQLTAGQDLPKELADRVHRVCSDPGIASAALATRSRQLQDAMVQLRARRSEAREALLLAEAAPEQAGAQQAAAHALDAARGAAHAVTAAAAGLAPSVRRIADATAALREAFHSSGVLRAGVPVYLARYEHGGNAILKVDLRPHGILVEGVQAAQQDTHTLVFRFRVVETHYIDLELGIGVTGGLPNIPTLVAENGGPVLRNKPVDEFLGIGLVELEPARIFVPDKWWAGLLRFPVLGIPLSRDPTQNFFVGAGLGWTGIGSICAGPYILRERGLRDGYSYGEMLPAGTSFSAVTKAEVNVGWFVTGSIDLVGLFHWFFPVHPKAMDAATGHDL